MKLRRRPTIHAELPAAPPLRVLVMSHMDPRLSRGGAEIAAFQLYETLRARSDVTAWFLAAIPINGNERLGVRITQPFGEDSYAYVGQGFDHFVHANPDSEFPPEFMELLRRLKPDVVHLHHYTNFGVEVLFQIRRALPGVRIVLTLHEYLAICRHFGQMVKRPGFALCDRATPRDCRRCFPEHTEQDFFLREIYLKRFFREVDTFIAPSHFLQNRYVAWGLPIERMNVIENGMPEVGAGADTLAPPPTENGLMFGFFGQISVLKGINVLFEAASLLHDMQAAGVRIEVYGDPSSQPEAMQADFVKRLRKVPLNLQFRGPYENAQVNRLMAGVHAVIVPSIWWENSPLVIQEALRSRRPVICSDIGGMAEKVRDGLDGFHFRAGDGQALAHLLARLAADPTRLAGLQQTMARPPNLAATAAQTMAAYREPRPHSRRISEKANLP